MPKEKSKKGIKLDEYLERGIQKSVSHGQEEIKIRCVSCDSQHPFGATHCWNCGTSLLRETNTHRNDGTRHLSKRELANRLAALEHEYRLARLGLNFGALFTVLSLIAGCFTLLMLSWTVTSFFTGNHVVIIYAVMAVALIVYFAFVFGRIAEIRAEISETKKQISISLGDKVR